MTASHYTPWIGGHYTDTRTPLLGEPRFPTIRVKTIRSWITITLAMLILLTISDHLLTHEALPAEDRERSFADMFRIALEAAFA